MDGNPYAQAPQHYGGNMVPDLSAMYRAMVPSLYGEGDYSDPQWQEWLSKSQQRDAAGRPVTQEGLEHMRYLEAAKPIFVQRAGEFIAKYPDLAQRYSAEDGQAAMDSVLGLRRLRPDEQGAKEFASLLLSYVRDTGIFPQQDDGKPSAEQKDLSVTPEQYEKWPNDPTPGPKLFGSGPGSLPSAKQLNARYRLAPAGQEAMQRTMEYNLLSAFQTEPQHRPLPLQNPLISGIAGPVASVVDSGLSLRDPTSQNTPGTRQTKAVFNPSPLNSMRYAMGVYDEAQQADPEFWKGSRGSPVPQGSLMTPEGLMTNMNTSNTAYGDAYKFLTYPLMKPAYKSVTGEWVFTEADRQALLDYEHLNDRVTPVRHPDSTVDFNALTAAVKQDHDHDYQKATVYTPQLAKALGMPGFYPSPFVNDFAMVVPGILGDPANAAFTAATGGLGVALGGGPRAIGQALLSNASDIPSEGAFNTGLTLGYAPETYFNYFTGLDNLGSDGFPQYTNPLRTKSGRTPHPDLPEYDTAVKAFEEAREKNLDEIKRVNENQRKQTEQWMKSRGGRPTMTQMEPRPPEPDPTPAGLFEQPYETQSQRLFKPRRPFD